MKCQNTFFLYIRNKILLTFVAQLFHFLELSVIENIVSKSKSTTNNIIYLEVYKSIADNPLLL